MEIITFSVINEYQKQNINFANIFEWKQITKLKAKILKFQIKKINFVLFIKDKAIWTIKNNILL